MTDEVACSICEKLFVPIYHRGRPVKFCSEECRKEQKRRLKRKPEYREKAKAANKKRRQRPEVREKTRVYKAKLRARKGYKRPPRRFEPFTWISA